MLKGSVNGEPEMTLVEKMVEAKLIEKSREEFKNLYR